MATLRAGGIVLAAGRSTRMGTQKLLLPWRGTTVIRHIVSAALGSRLAQVVAVTGSDSGAVEEALAIPGNNLQFARNPNVDRGMLSSVRVGLEALPGDLDGVVVFLGDQPSVSAELVNGLLGFAAQETAAIAVPAWEGRRGHPLYFSMQYRDEILRDFDDKGLRGLLTRYADAVREWPVDDAGVTMDMDTPEDYARLKGED